MSDLENFYQGQISKRPLFGGRRIPNEARNVSDEVFLTALKMQGAEELTTYAMRKAKNMDEARRDLAGNDELLNTIFADLEVGGVGKLKQLQDGVFSPFKF